MGSDYFPLNFKGAKFCNQRFPMQECYPNPQESEMKPPHNTGKTKISSRDFEKRCSEPSPSPHTRGTHPLQRCSHCEALSSLSSPPATFLAETLRQILPDSSALFWGFFFYVPTGLPDLSAEKLPHGPEPPHRGSREGRARLLTGFPAPHPSSLPQAPPCAATGHLLKKNKT